MTALFPYQQEGAAWLATKQHAMLADPMGLGKTAQAIAAADRVGALTVLVLCPASVREVWRREVAKFSEGRVVNVLYKAKTPIYGAVNIASYDGALKMHEALMGLKYDLLICDEAHFLKNPSAKRTKAVYGGKGKVGFAHVASRVWLLSGTPAPNNPIELFPHCRTLFKFPEDYYGFMRKYCTVTNNGFGEKITGGKNMPDLKARLSPYVLRRKKEEVLKDLPPIRFDMLPLEPRVKLTFHDSELERIEAALANENPMRALESIAQHVTTLRRYIGTAKIDTLSNWIKDQIEGGMEKLVVFAHHREVLSGIAENLIGVSDIALLTGNSSATERDNAVQRFQNDPKCKIFLGNLQAAGTGITLTAASELVFAEYSWVPAENQQAAMRVHRIGQKNAVQIRYAVVAGSLDERIADVVRKKNAVLRELFA